MMALITTAKPHASTNRLAAKKMKTQPEMSKNMFDGSHCDRISNFKSSALPQHSRHVVLGLGVCGKFATWKFPKAGK